MPHGRDVEPASDLDFLREVAEVQRQHQHVRDALVALALEVVLREPERVVAGPVHQLRDGFALREHRSEMFVGQPAIVDRRPVEAFVVQIDVAREQASESRDHGRVLRVLESVRCAVKSRTTREEVNIWSQAPTRIEHWTSTVEPEDVTMRVLHSAWETTRRWRHAWS